MCARRDLNPRDQLAFDKAGRLVSYQVRLLALVCKLFTGSLKLICIYLFKIRFFVMIEAGEARELVSRYDADKIHIGVFGSHSAIDTLDSAKEFGFPVYLIVEKGREELYTRDFSSLIDGEDDKVMFLDKFEHLLHPENQKKLVDKNTIFFANRSTVAYCTTKKVEEEFKVPLFGSRRFLCAEDSNPLEGHSSQYQHLDAAGIPRPRQYEKPEDIDGLVIVKVRQANRPKERAFFEAVDYENFLTESKNLLEMGVISKEGLENAVIEEKLIGVYTNAVFHFSPLFNSVDLLGFGDREQTNLSSFLNQSAQMQGKLSAKGFIRTNEEMTHRPKRVRESYIPQVINAARNFQEALKKEEPSGMIGLAGLQGAWPLDQNNKPRFTVYDVAYRWTGDLIANNFMRILTRKYRRHLPEHVHEISSMGDLSMLDIYLAAKQGNLNFVVT